MLDGVERFSVERQALFTFALTSSYACIAANYDLYMTRPDYSGSNLVSGFN